MRRRSNRFSLLFFILIIASSMIICSLTGILAPVEGIVAQPLDSLAGFFNGIALSINQFTGDFADIQELNRRNGELETQLALLQTEITQLREIASDYQRLTELLNYASGVDDQEFITADVVHIDIRGFMRNIVINRGTRDGITVGMPVVTQLGLVGRVIQVSANAAQVQLISDENSSISSRLQTTRSPGTVQGQAAGNLRMRFIPLGSDIIEGDLVITSGLGGNLPPDIVIGQVVSSRQFEFELSQEAELRSLINFDTLEMVMVITSFQPVDISVFEQETP